MEQTQDLRSALTERMKQALKNSDKRTLSTTRLILAAIKDRDIEARAHGKESISDDEILRLLTTMIKQCRESIVDLTKLKRVHEVEQVNQEIEIITSFLPPPLSSAELATACTQVVKNLQVTSLKDMGRVMNELKSRYPGRLDPIEAIKIVRTLLQ